MFRALEATGHRGFLGCPSVLYEQELEQFFDTAIVQDGDVTCAVSGKYVAIYEDRFAGVFNLPTDGLTDFSEVPNDLVLQASTLFSNSSKHVQFSCKKRLIKYEFHLLNDILAKSITVKAGSFDAVTHEIFLMMTAIQFGIKVNWSKNLFEVLKDMADRTTKIAKGFAAQICVLLKGDPAVTLGEAKTFPPLKIISAKTMNTYIATNKTIDTRGESDEPEDADDVHVELVAEKAVSKKRPAAVSKATVVKKKRTTSGKAVSKENDLALTSVAQDVVPIQLETDVVESDFAEGLAMGTDLAEPVITRSDDITVELSERSTAVTDEEELEPLSKVLKTSVSPTSDDESLSIDEHLAQIPDGMMFVELSVQGAGGRGRVRLISKGIETALAVRHAPPLTHGPNSPILTHIIATEPTKIKFCHGIEIRGVEAGDWYKANLPIIAATDKGKKQPEEPDTVKGHQALEHLRNFKAMRPVKDILSKKEKMLVWAETDSLETAIQRRMFIIAKYRELLLRKYLIARRTNLVSGLPTTAIDQRTLDLLPTAHQQAVRNLLKQMRAHGMKWTRPVSSMLFEEPNIERGFFIPRTHKTIFSTCWITNLLKIEGSWLVEEGYDRVVCRCTKCVSSDWPSLPDRIFVRDLSPICLFLEPIQCLSNFTPPAVKTWGWYRVCTEVLQYPMFGCLNPVSSFNLCTALVPVGPVLGDISIPRRIVDNVSYPMQIIDSVFPDPVVQVNADSVFVDQAIQTGVDQCPDPIGSDLFSQQHSSSDSSMHFTDDILQGADTVFEQILVPSTAAPATDINKQFAQLRDSISQLSIKQLKTRSSIGNLQNHLLSRIDELEKASANAHTQQDQDLRGLFKSILQEVQIQKTALSFEVHEFKQGVRAQSGIFSTDLADIRKEVRDLSKEFDDKLAAIRNDLLEFRVETQEQYATLSANLAELIAFVTKGRDDKRGEVGSSHGRGQPPPEDRSKPGSRGGSRSEPSRKRGSSGSKQRDWRYWISRSG
ncbi:hypothetical protein F511_11203 [Dorcoceras hygrometricum]|uniref:Dystroglycan-like n=1 Tax=Dorcoceras hygrometricum TaxID=472368 RepID=A0A2Z7D3X2_9LAMI|nr:hypothetical protein F511_11203 [Dorcoceras hygrometricum]